MNASAKSDLELFSDKEIMDAVLRRMPYPDDVVQRAGGIALKRRLISEEEYSELPQIMSLASIADQHFKLGLNPTQVKIGIDAHTNDNDFTHKVLNFSAREVKLDAQEEFKRNYEQPRWLYGILILGILLRFVALLF